MTTYKLQKPAVPLRNFKQCKSKNNNKLTAAA